MEIIYYIIKYCYVLVFNNGVCLQWFFTDSIYVYNKRDTRKTITYPLSISSSVLCADVQYAQISNTADWSRINNYINTDSSQLTITFYNWGNNTNISCFGFVITD